MPEKDTITIADSLISRFIVIDKLQDTIAKEIISPVSSLWPSQTLSSTLTGNHLTTKQEQNSQSYIVSGLALLFIFFSILFYRGIFATVPYIIKNTFSFRSQKALEEKLSYVSQRNITTLIASLFITLFIVLVFGKFLEEATGIDNYMLILASFGTMVGYWIFKSLLLRFAGWVSKQKHLFWLIGKIGYNHLILAAFCTIPIIILTIFIPSFNDILLLNVLSICYLLIYILYLVRVYQSVISYHFSLFFYILYLCTVEILPIALFTNFLLSYQ